MKKVYMFNGVTITEGVIVKGTDTGLKNAVFVDEYSLGYGAKTKRKVVSRDSIYSKKEELVRAIEEHISYLQNKLKTIELEEQCDK